MRISKKLRAIAADLLDCCASECATSERLVFIAEISEAFLDDLDLNFYQTDQVMLIAACAYRDADDAMRTVDYPHPAYPQWHIDNYLEAATKLREGWTPNLNS